MQGVGPFLMVGPYQKAAIFCNTENERVAYKAGHVDTERIFRNLAF